MSKSTSHRNRAIIPEYDGIIKTAIPILQQKRIKPTEKKILEYMCSNHSIKQTRMVKLQLKSALARCTKVGIVKQNNNDTGGAAVYQLCNNKRDTKTRERRTIEPREKATDTQSREKASFKPSVKSRSSVGNKTSQWRPISKPKISKANKPKQDISPKSTRNKQPKRRPIRNKTTGKVTDEATLTACNQETKTRITDNDSSPSR